MGKLYLIIILVIAVILGGVAILSQNSKSPSLNDLALQNPTPTLTVSPLLDATQRNNQQQQPQQQQQPVITQGPEQANQPIGPQAATVSATVKTSKGDIVLTLFRADVPGATQNFIDKAKSGFYKNLTFHRVEDWVIQGGDPTGTGTGGNDMPTELNQKPFVVGSLGVAAHPGPKGNINNDAQFFITKTAADWLNGQYTNFGIVTQGMDVVNRIAIGDKILGISIAN